MGNCCCKSQHRLYLEQERGQNKLDAPAQEIIVPEKVEGTHVIQRKKKRKAARDYLPPFVNYNEDFLTNHLKYELSLTKLTSMRKIRRRQIYEHFILRFEWRSFETYDAYVLDVRSISNRDSLMNAWLQRTFLDIWYQAHEDLFVKSEDIKVVRRKVAEQFMFELFELKQFCDSGISSHTFVQKLESRRVCFDESISDDALFHILRNLQTKYPQTAIKGSLKVPEIQTTKTNVNLLDHFPAKCYSDPKNMNYQTIYEDVRFMLQKAIDQQENFKNDMKDLLGEDVLTCPKVNQVTKDGKTSFNACAVRRVFVKWAENLLDKCPDLKKTKVFMSFIRSKGDIVNGFFFKSTIRPTTHKAVIDCLSMIIELAKYELNSGKRRKEFIFNIYDLLRCKVKRKTTQQVVTLFRKLEKTNKTKSGKLFQVIRAKNRFQTNNKDVLVNFRYGDVLVAEAQIGIDIIEEQTLSKQAKLNNAVSHFIYELERSIFGPTLELMMQYEDNQKPDLTMNFQAEGEVEPRTYQIIDTARSTKRKCLHGHEMVSMSGNYWTKLPDSEQLQSPEKLAFSCIFCNSQYNLACEFDYCYECTGFYCKDCRQDYQKIDLKNTLVTIDREDVFIQINSFRELSDICQKQQSYIVLFWAQGSSASVLFKDTMIFHQTKLNFQLNQYIPKIGHVKYSKKPGVQNMVQKLGIKEYPTLILFNQSAVPFKTIIGFSWYEAPILYAIQKHILQNKKYEEIKLLCTQCQQWTNMFVDDKRENSVCINCFNTTTDEYLPQLVEGYGSYCKQGHYRCMNCSFHLLKIPSTYKDFLGSTYLSTKFVNPDLKKCPNGHQTQLYKGNPTKSWQYTCWNCQKKYFYDNQHGVGVCTKGESSLCPRCMGAYIPTFVQLSDLTLIKHFAESSEEQMPFCDCERPYKKVYQTRISDLEEWSHINKKHWECWLCKRQKKSKQLHIACFECPEYSDHENKKSYQYCMRCVKRAKMITGEQNIKVDEQQCLEKCPFDDKILLYTSRMKQGKLTFSCKFCQKLYYGHSERYYCPGCHMNCCDDCKEKLWQKNPPTCKQKCSCGNQLKYMIVKRKGSLFCDGCIVMISDECFSCSQDNYMLCQKCAVQQSADFVGDFYKQAQRQGEQGEEPESESDDSELANVHDGYEEEQGSDYWNEGDENYEYGGDSES